jgi:acetyl-CoA C-acetyltransferase
MVERLREQPGASGLVTGNGWYLTKHSATVVASAPRETPLGPAPEPPIVAGGDETATTAPADGAARVESYTVLYERDGAPVRGVIVGRTDAGQRFLANTPEDRELLEGLVAEEAVGRRGRVTHRDGGNLFDPA